jgi:hypothetical protein
MWNNSSSDDPVLSRDEGIRRRARRRLTGVFFIAP